MANKDQNENNSIDNDVDGIDDGMLFDPSAAEDAGVDTELETAATEAKVITLRKVENKSKLEDYAEEVRKEEDIVLRARKLLQGNLIAFPDTRKTAEGYVALNCDKNRITAFDALFGDGPQRPHIDTFCGRLVDWKGEIVDDRYSMVEMLNALHAMGLRQQSLESIRKSFRDWGLQVKRNDLIEKFTASIPEWDGTPRLEQKLIDLFECFDTPLNRSFGVYFWLSIYCRITKPGCMAPMVLSIFGGQDVGKSYFSKLICRVLLNDPEANPVQLDMGANKIDFLRSITGNAIVANIGEMTGFSRADLNDIKQFITATADDMHQKFEGHFQQQRQWIAILDGNTYAGLQRDDTGNRRFYPIFAGQLPDKYGQPDWRHDFKVDFSNFEKDLWQLMAECRLWLEQNGDIEGYNKYVDSVSKAVKEFSQQEMEQGRGAVVDYTLDTYLVPCLLDLKRLNAEILEGRKNRGVWITTAAIRTRIRYMAKGADIKENHLKTKMTAMGFSSEMIKNVRGYLLPKVMAEKEYMERIQGINYILDEDAVEVIAKFSAEDEGF